MLAPRTEALLLTSATPTTVTPESFAELIRLLDPTAIADPHAIDADAIDHLYVRRHKAHEDRQGLEVRADWEDRLEPKPLLIDAARPKTRCSPSWPTPGSTRRAAPTPGKGRTLFPWTLFKAALSSHRVLGQTVNARRKTLAERADAQSPEGRGRRASSASTSCWWSPPSRALRPKHPPTRSEQLEAGAPIEQLRDIGWPNVGHLRGGVRSPSASPRSTGWPKPVPSAAKPDDQHASAVLHGGTADVKQMDVDRGLRPGPLDVRLLLTGDMASRRQLHRRVPPPHPLRSALVSHHRFPGAQRPHRPLRPAATHPTCGAAQPRPPAARRRASSPSSSSAAARGAPGVRRRRVAAGVADVALERRWSRRACAMAPILDEAIPAEPRPSFDGHPVGRHRHQGGAHVTTPSPTGLRRGSLHQALQAFDDATATLDLRRG
ncbi:MAG: hypothetical protein R2704_05755 [Microthrixaceae bacterium]